jgi:hypothetical protein
VQDTYQAGYSDSTHSVHTQWQYSDSTHPVHTQWHYPPSPHSVTVRTQSTLSDSTHPVHTQSTQDYQLQFVTHNFSTIHNQNSLLCYSLLTMLCKWATLKTKTYEQKDMLPRAFLPKTTADHDLWQWFNINAIVKHTNVSGASARRNQGEQWKT